jgi:4'-phosphopantetheinyl transferase
MVEPKVTLTWASVADIGGALDDLLAALPADERARAARFRVDDARRRFVLARTVLRRTLARQLGCGPAEVELAEGEHGKPHLDGRWPRGPRFNLSHSGDLVVVALAESEVGVDIEQLRRVANAEKLAHRFFSSSERARILATVGAERDRTFLRIWTQKEAYLKAIGAGVGMALRTVETEPDPARPPRLRAVDGDRFETDRWTLLEAEIPGAVCTVAVEHEDPLLEVSRWRLPAGSL